MALKPISGLFRRGDIALDEVDVRYCVERYLKDAIGVTALRCEAARDGRVVVWAPSPLVRQEVCLLEWDLARHLEAEVQFRLTALAVTQS